MQCCTATVQLFCLAPVTKAKHRDANAVHKYKKPTCYLASVTLLVFLPKYYFQGVNTACIVLFPSPDCHGLLISIVSYLNKL